VEHSEWNTPSFPRSCVGTHWTAALRRVTQHPRSAKYPRSAKVSRPRRNPRPKVSMHHDSRLAILETFGRECTGSEDPRTARYRVRDMSCLRGRSCEWYGLLSRRRAAVQCVPTQERGNEGITRDKPSLRCVATRLRE